jgi:hypothetical protein
VQRALARTEEDEAVGEDTGRSMDEDEFGDDSVNEMPVESVLHGMRTRFEPVTFDQMARFEAAEDILNQHVGTAMARVSAEERKAVPNQRVIDEMHCRAQEFVSARRALRADDAGAVEEVLARARAVTEELEGA